MSGPIGHTFMYNLIIIFIVIVFGLLAGTLSYYKAFKINNRIVTSIEKFEGYNKLSQPEIETILTAFGYRAGSPNCPLEYKGMHLITFTDEEHREKHNYCIYADQTSAPADNTFFQYGVLTYMNIDLPFIKEIDIKVFTKTNRIYSFNGTKPDYIIYK